MSCRRAGCRAQRELGNRGVASLHLEEDLQRWSIGAGFERQTLGSPHAEKSEKDISGRRESENRGSRPESTRLAGRRGNHWGWVEDGVCWGRLGRQETRLGTGGYPGT